MHLNEYLEERLESSGISLEELRELLVRLLNYGVLVRDESQIERELYDRFVRTERIATEALELYGITVYHERRFEYVRLYPPGSRTPTADQAEEHPFAGSLRARLSQHEVALVLVLRAQYDKALREGKIDERGYATEPFEAVSLAMKSWLNRGLPEKATERKRVFQRLRQLRLIEFREDEDLDRSEAWLRIHPMIVDFVSLDAVEALRSPNLPAGAGDTPDSDGAEAQVEEGEDVS